MTKVKLLRFTTDVDAPVTVVEHEIEDWLSEQTKISVISISSSSRETFEGETPVLEWDVTITYEPKQKLACIILTHQLWGPMNLEEGRINAINKWCQQRSIHPRDIIGYQEHTHELRHSDVTVTYLTEDTDE